MDYLTYDNFIKMGGQLDKTTFNILYFRLKAKVDKYTSQRIKNDTVENIAIYAQDLEQLMFVLIPLVEKQSTDTVTSMSNNGISQSFSAKTAQDLESDIYELIFACLSSYVNHRGVGLCYLGVESCN